MSFQVVRARATKSHVVRVAFNEEPKHESAAGRFDALNPSKYQLQVVEGQGGSIQPVGIDPEVIAGPAIGLAAGEYGIDLHVDKPFIIGLTYEVAVFDVTSALGAIPLSPNTAEFYGILRLLQATRPPRLVDLVDWEMPIAQFTGYRWDDSGDVGVHGGVASLRKRVLRRCTTQKGAYTWMPRYGVNLRLKDVASLASLQELKADLQSQVREEPDVSTCAVSLQMHGEGLLIMTLDIQHATLGQVRLTLQRSPDGAVT